MNPGKTTVVLVGLALVLTPVAADAVYDAVYDLTLDHPDTVGELVDSVHDGYRQVGGQGQGVEFDDVVHVTHRDADGTVLNQFRVHNALMEGENIIRNQTLEGNESPDKFHRNWTAISVGNGTAPTDTSGSLAGEVTAQMADTGFPPNTSTTIELIDHDGGDHTDGIEWNVTSVFTSEAITELNTTSLKNQWNAPSTLDYFAGANFGRTIPFEDGDTLTVEWNVDPD